MPGLLIHDCHALVPGPDGLPTVARHQDIAIDGNRITALGPTAPLPSDPALAVIEGKGRLAMPGLINTHAHVPMVIFRGLAEDVSIERWFNEFMWPLESNLQAEDVYWGMMLGLMEMIEGGVTTVADHYFFMDQAARAVEEAGTRAALGWAVFGDRGHDALAETAGWVERWQGKADGRITTWMAPHAPYTCDDDFLRATAAHAGRLGAGIHIHAAEEMGQTRASIARHGLTPIQVLERAGILDHRCIIAHGCGITPEDIPLLARRRDRVGIAHAPKTYLKLGMGLTPIADLRQAGIPVGLATDGAVSNNTLDILESLRLMAMLQKHETGIPEVMPIAEALDLATRQSAAVLGLEDRIGQLEPGLLADIILVDLGGAHCRPLHSLTASLVYNARASDVQTVIIDGRVVMRDRQLLTLDRQKILAEVDRSMQRLSRRVPGKRIQVYNP